MEIHTPSHPVMTWKEFGVHLLIVTAGILIALSLEGIVESVHHRTIVREAREIMRTEIETNGADLDTTLQRIELQREWLGKAIHVFDAKARGEKPKDEGLDYGLEHALNYRAAQLHSAAHSAAELMDAFGYMDYREVGRYATIYDSQSRFMDAQVAAFADGTAAFGWRQQRNLEAASTAGFATFADRLRQALGSLTVAGQFGVTLRKEYDSFLAGK